MRRLQPANLSAPPRGLDEARALSRVPQVRRSVRANVVLRQPDLDRTWQARADRHEDEAREWADAGSSTRMWGALFAIAAVCYLVLAAWGGVLAVGWLAEAGQRAAAEADTRGGW